MLYSTKLIEVVDNKTTAENHRVARQNLGISQKEVAEILQVAPQKVSKLENGRQGWDKVKSVEYCLALVDIIERNMMAELDLFESTWINRVEGDIRDADSC